MMLVVFLLLLGVANRCVSGLDSAGTINEDLLTTIQELKMTINGMDRRMVAIERKMELLEEENEFLKQRLVDVQNYDKKPTMVQQNTTRTSDPARRFVLAADGAVAFLASLTNPTLEQHLGVNQNIIFNNVLTNIGGAFNVNHGIFTVPQAGVYLISATVMSYIDTEIRAAIMVNGQRMVSIFGHGSVGRHEQGTQVAVLQLKAGNTVTVENIDLTDITVYGDRYTSFTGVLLYPTE